MDRLARAFSPDGFMPHGFCFLWDAKLLWLHAVSDGLIFAAYLTIPFTLVYFARQRRDLSFRWIFWCFGAFIVSCGFTHGMDVWTLWHPDYWVSGSIKAITAVVSVATALLLVNLVPEAVATPSLQVDPSGTFAVPQITAFTRQRLLLAYGLAPVTTVATLLIITAGFGTTSDAPVVILVVPVMLTAYVGGLAPGLVCTALSTVAAIYFVIPPARSWHIANPVDHARWIALLVTGVALSLLSEAQHRARRRAQKYEARLAAVIGSATDAIITVDERLQITLFNPAAEGMFACRAADVLGRRVKDLIPDLFDSAEHLPASGQPHMAVHSMPGRTEIFARRADGAIFPIEASIGQIEGAQEKQFTVVVRDISERKEGEAFRARLSAIVESSDDAIIGKNLEGVITSWNRGAEKLYGYTAEEVLGKPLRTIFPPELEHELQEVLLAIRRGATVEHLDTVRLRKDGTEVNVSVTVSPVRDGKGRVIGASAITRDISVQKQAEERLREEEERFRQVVEAAPNAMLVVDRQGRISLVNAQTKVLFGYKPEELTGKSVEILVPERYRTGHVSFRSDFFKEPKARGMGVGRDLYGLRKDGEEVPVEIGLSPLSTREGVSVLATITDITERKRAEEALRHAEERFRALVTASSNVLYCMSADWSEMNYLRGGNFIADTENPSRDWVLEYIYPDDRPSVVRAIEEAKRTGSLFELEHRVRRADGSPGWTSSRAVPLRNKAGEIVEWFGAANDITERKLAEERLRESEEQFRTLANAIPQLCWMANADGWIFWYNQRWYQYTGTTPKDMEGWGWQSVHDPDVLPKVLETWKVSIATGNPFDMTFPLRGADGVFRPFLTRVMPLCNPDGTVVRWFGTNTDVSEQRKWEETLARSNRDLEQFAYVASHDLQEPLRAVGGCVSLLKRRYEGQIDARADEFIQHAVDGCARMQGLIDDLLTYSRIGRKEGGRRIVQCDAALATALKNLSASIEETGAQVSSEKLTSVRAEASQMVMLFQNLVGNAIKFRKPGEVPQIRIGATLNANYNTFSCADNGIGIAPEHFERIFGVFQRLHTRREYPGTGIGLAVCKRIVEQHGGRIWVESKPGEGATFLFTLPKASEDS